MTPSRRALWIALISVGLAAASELPGAAQGASQRPHEVAPGAVQDPDGTQNLEPCCPVRPHHASVDRTRRVGQLPGREAPRESPFDVATLRRLRKAAAADPAAPAGRQLRLDPAASPAARAPGLRASFPGLGQGEVGLGVFPPDSQLAVGPEHVLQAVNIAVRLTDRTGGNALSQTLTEHFGLAAVTGGSLEPVITDPKTHYDPLSGRFFLLVLEIDLARSTFSRAYLSVSRGSAPASLTDTDWCKYAINTKLGDTWGDYPGLGMNQQWLAISTNNFPFEGDFTLQSRLFVVDKVALTDNASSCPTAKFFNFNLRKNDLGGVHRPARAAL